MRHLGQARRRHHHRAAPGATSAQTATQLSGHHAMWQRASMSLAAITAVADLRAMRCQGPRWTAACGPLSQDATGQVGQHIGEPGDVIAGVRDDQPSRTASNTAVDDVRPDSRAARDEYGQPGIICAWPLARP